MRAVNVSLKMKEKAEAVGKLQKSKDTCSNSKRIKDTSKFSIAPLIFLTFGIFTSHFALRCFREGLLDNHGRNPGAARLLKPPPQTLPDGTVVRTRVCLNMMVRDEEDEILGMLRSVKDHILGYVICDTGSVDATPKLADEFLTNNSIPGAIVHQEWENFAHNRNLCLDVAHDLKGNECDYWLFLEPDHVFKSDNGERLYSLDLTHDAYMLSEVNNGLKYANKRLVASFRRWLYVGAVHEYLTLKDDDGNRQTTGSLPESIYVHHNIDNKPGKYEKYRKILEKAKEEDPENDRTRYYLGQTYGILGENELAIQEWVKRIELGGWQEEVYMSAWGIATILEWMYQTNQTISQETRDALARWIQFDNNTQISLETALAAFQKAAETLPYRKEASYKLAYLYRTEFNNFEKCMEHAEEAHERGPHHDRTLFSQMNIVEYKIDDEMCTCGYYVPVKAMQGVRACQRLVMKLEEKGTGIASWQKELLNRTKDNLHWYLNGTKPLSRDNENKDEEEVHGEL